MVPDVIDARKMMYIAKSNEFIQNAIYELGTREQKILQYFLSAIQPEDTGRREYHFTIKELSAVLDVDLKSNYTSLKGSIKKIRDSSFWLNIDGVDKLFAWISNAEINSAEDVITVRFDELFLPYITNLITTGNYTQYRLVNILGFSSMYSFRFYDLLKSCLRNGSAAGSFEIKIDQLRKLFRMKTKYQDFPSFRRRVLEPAIAEINQQTDISVEYKFVFVSGHAVDAIRFDVKAKERPALPKPKKEDTDPE